MLPYNLNQLPVFLILTLVMFAIVVFRYVLVAGFFFLYFYRWKFKEWKERKISKKAYQKGQFAEEIKWSVITSLIFSVAGAATALLWQQGFTAIYLEINTYGWIYFFVSILITMFIHETYYYWVHRWMHHPKIYRIVHKVHHDSLIASPWTAFSFHPWEAVIEAIILPIIVLFLPLHPFTILIHLTIMTLSSVINHLDIEIYPKGFEKNSFGKYLIGATHHSLHHAQFKYNFGLYFTFWDKWMQTESPLFEEKFREKTEKEA